MSLSPISLPASRLSRQGLAYQPGNQLAAVSAVSALQFSSVQQKLAEAKQREQNQNVLTEEQSALKGYPEYRDLMLSEIALSHNQTMTGMEFLQLVHKEQFYKKFGLKSNAKRLLATALCATLIGPITYDMIHSEMYNRFDGGGFKNIKRQFNFGVRFSPLIKAVGIESEYASDFSRIKYSDLVEINSDMDLIRLTPKGVRVLKNYELQQKNGQLIEKPQEKSKKEIQTEAQTQYEQLSHLFLPVFSDGGQYVSQFQLLSVLDQPKGWFSSGIDKSTILQKLRGRKSISVEEQLSLTQSLTQFVEQSLIKGNAKSTHFELTPAGIVLVKKGGACPSVVPLKETAQLLYAKELIWLNSEQEALRGSLEKETKVLERLRDEMTVMAESLAAQYRVCKALNEKKSSVNPSERSAFLKEVDQAVKLYRELSNKQDFYKTRYEEQETAFDKKAANQARKLVYIEKQTKLLQEKQWLLESNAYVFKPEEALRDFQTLAQQKYLFQHDLMVDLTSNPTEQDVNRILCEVSIEGALEEILSKPA